MTLTNPAHPRRRIGALIAAAAFTTACGAQPEKPTASPVPPIGHVHGIGLNPADQTVYLATHTGVYHIRGGTAAIVADRYQDTMGFTVAGPDDFLASGHPALADDAPNPLGLIQSSDRATTWRTLAFAGQEDFHSIDAVNDFTYAYAADGRLLMSKNRRTWTKILQAQLLDFAANPMAPRELVATTETGAVIAMDVGQEPTQLTAAPPLALIDRTATGDIVGVDPQGQVFTSTNDGASWARRTTLAGTPEALSVRASTWYAATTQGAYASTDQGRTWKQILRIPR